MTKIIQDSAMRQARAIASTIASLWNNYSDENSHETDIAMRDAFKEVDSLDFSQVDGVLASPLRYFARAFLHDDNPEDLTFAEMTESIEISLGILAAE